MENSHFGYHQIQSKVIQETEKAICFNLNRSWIHEGNLTWIPKSQMIIETMSLPNGDVDRIFYVKEWLWKKYQF